MAFIKLAPLGLIGKERRHIRFVFWRQLRCFERVHEFEKRRARRASADLAAFVEAGLGRAPGDGKVRILKLKEFVAIALQFALEGFAQLRKKRERPAEKADAAAHGASAGKTANRLLGDGVKDRARNFAFGNARIQKRHDVRFGENAAAGGDGVRERRACGKRIEASGIRIEKACHLVDEGARAACAGFVHAQLDAVREIEKLGVFAAELNGNVEVGRMRAQIDGGGEHFLHEGRAEDFGKPQCA